MAKRTFGSVRRLPSGRYQARYIGPDGMRYSAETTFDTRLDADAWLSLRHSEIVRDVWRAPTARADVVPLDDYWRDWIETRPLKPRTRSHYRQLYSKSIGPIFGHIALTAITPASIRSWYSKLDPDTPTWNAHAYAHLRTVLGSAVQDELIPSNPAHIRGAGTTRRKVKIMPATLEELAVIVEKMPDRLKLMIHLATWCQLRFGEITELRRRDVDLTNGVISTPRGVTRADGKTHIATPKSPAGVRDVTIPPHLMPAVREHLKRHVEAEKDALLFPAASGGNLAPTSLYRHFGPAREAAGRKDLRFHDLRHTGAVLAASTGATLAELMARLGHASPAAALRYQHVAKGRDAEIAASLSKLVGDE